MVLLCSYCIDVLFVFSMYVYVVINACFRFRHFCAWVIFLFQNLQSKNYLLLITGWEKPDNDDKCLARAGRLCVLWTLIFIIWTLFTGIQCLLWSRMQDQMGNNTSPT